MILKMLPGEALWRSYVVRGNYSVVCCLYTNNVQHSRNEHRDMIEDIIEDRTCHYVFKVRVQWSVVSCADPVINIDLFE